MEVGRHKDIMAHEHIIVGSNSNEIVKTFQYLGSLFNKSKFYPRGNKSRLKTGNSCYYSVQTLLSFQFLSKNTKIKIYKTIISPVVLYVCQTFSFPLREEWRIRVSENRIAR
jgi:hypothetical protein